jgi:hypothetical protein
MCLTEALVDKALSIITALAFVLAALLVGWGLSGGRSLIDGIDYDLPARPRSLAEGVAVLGGPLGTWGGVVLLGGIGLVIYGLQELCNYWFALLLVGSMKRAKHPTEEMVAKIDRSPISRGLKKRLKRWLDKSAERGMRSAE